MNIPHKKYPLGIKTRMDITKRILPIKSLFDFLSSEDPDFIRSPAETRVIIEKTKAPIAAAIIPSNMMVAITIPINAMYIKPLYSYCNLHILFNHNFTLCANIFHSFFATLKSSNNGCRGKSVHK